MWTRARPGRTLRRPLDPDDPVREGRRVKDQVIGAIPKQQLQAKLATLA
jgi:hypothetical protein